MEVDVLCSTNNPERLVCQCARGDYYDGYVGDTEYPEVMRPVDYDENDVDAAIERLGSEPTGSLHETHPVVVEAKTRSFVEKQLSRGHYGPWEHPQITFAVKGVSRVTMAQITRHRHMTFDVQSQRYVDFSETEAITPKSLVDPDHFTREAGELELTEERQREWKRRYEKHTEMCMELYENMVNDGVPKEDARFVLPLGTPVNMTFSGNARTFMHLLDMRKKANAQWEIRQLSEELIEHLKDWMPYTYDYYDRHAPHKLSP